MMNSGKFKLYTASAGSGKTYTLVKEYLTLCLSSDNSSCKNILAVTFTNKAANEMKAKVLFFLDGFINDDKKCNDMKNDILKILNVSENVLKQRAVSLYDNILHNYSDFNISTIDGFVQQISRSFAKELNLPAQYRVLLDDDDLLDGLIQCIDEHIDKDDEYLTEMLTDFVDFQLDEESSWRIDLVIREFVTKLLKESAYKKGEILSTNELSNNEYLKIKESLNGIHAKYKKNITHYLQDIKDFESQYNISSADYFSGARGLPSMLNKIEKDINIAPSSLVGSTIKKVFDGEKDWFSSKINKNNLATITKSGVDVLNMYRQLAENHKNLFLVNLIRKNLYLYALRSTLLSIINQYVDETNKVHISEFNKRISDILDDCSIPFIYERIGSRYKHFFIDEFQDTSLLQWHNFLPLLHNGLSENNMSLIVGDAKQAIYRFRSGEVEQIINLPSIYKAKKNAFFDECENTLKNNISKVSLQYNYRSKKNIIDFNNSFFRLSKNKLTSDDYREVYTNNLIQKCPKQYEYDGFVNVEIFDMDKFSDDDNQESPKTLYKNAVKESILKDINILKDKGFSFSDVAILVRSNSDGADIADFLSKNNIPIISSDSILLKSSDRVRLIMLTLKYLVDDKNEVTKLALSHYVNICKKEALFDIHASLQECYDKDKINNLRNQSYSLYDLCDGIIKMYGFDVIEDEFLQYFMNLVYEWQNAENEGIDAFVEYWDKKSNTFFVKITADIDAVQIMTIHKSKGLEFKVVMYPYAYTKVPDGFKGGEKWMSPNELHLLNEIPGIDSFILPINKGLLDTDMEHHYTEEVEKAAFDDFNIMYVAMTRPSELMFIYTNNKSKAGDDDESSSDSYNFFVEYFNAANGYYVTDANGDVHDVMEQEDYDLLKNRFQQIDNDNSVTYKLGEILYVKAKESDDDKIKILELKNEIPSTMEWTKVLSIEADPTMFWAENDFDYLPQEWGNLVHDILSKINTIEDSHSILQNYINEGSIDNRQAELLQKKFDEIINIEEIKAAFSKEAVVRNEMEILVVNKYDDNEILRPDRYAELDDKVILIDYKTGKHHEKYYEQMKNYVLALQDMGVKKHIEAYLLYLGENIEVKQVFLDRLF